MLTGNTRPHHEPQSPPPRPWGCGPPGPPPGRRARRSSASSQHGGRLPLRERLKKAGQKPQASTTWPWESSSLVSAASNWLQSERVEGGRSPRGSDQRELRPGGGHLGRRPSWPAAAAAWGSLLSCGDKPSGQPRSGVQGPRTFRRHLRCSGGVRPPRVPCRGWGATLTEAGARPRAAAAGTQGCAGPSLSDTNTTGTWGPGGPVAAPPAGQQELRVGVRCDACPRRDPKPRAPTPALSLPLGSGGLVASPTRDGEHRGAARPGASVSAADTRGTGSDTPSPRTGHPGPRSASATNPQEPDARGRRNATPTTKATDKHSAFQRVGRGNVEPDPGRDAASGKGRRGGTKSRRSPAAARVLPQPRWPEAPQPRGQLQGAWALRTRPVLLPGVPHPHPHPMAVAQSGCWPPSSGSTSRGRAGQPA